MVGLIFKDQTNVMVGLIFKDQTHRAAILEELGTAL
jgi:hypothetical protein